LGRKDFPNYPTNGLLADQGAGNPRRRADLGQVDFVLDAPLQDIAPHQADGRPQDRGNRAGPLDLPRPDTGSAELKYSDVRARTRFADQRVRQAMYQAIDINAINPRYAPTSQRRPA